MRDTNRTLISDYFACLNRHDLENAAALVAPEFQIHGIARRALHVQEWMRALEAVFDSFPDGRLTIDDAIVEGYRLAIRYTFCGTHLAAFRDAPPSGRRVQAECAIILHMSGGQIYEAWFSADFGDIFRQLGLPPIAYNYADYNFIDDKLKQGEKN